VSTFTGLLIRRSQQAHVAAWQRVVSAEITSVQFGVLNVLNSAPGSSQRELCSQLDLDRSTMTDIVQRLQKRGFIERVRHPDDKRRNALALTPVGKREFDALVPKVMRVDQVLTGGMNEQDANDLRRLLSLMLSTMDDAARRQPG